MYIWHKNLALRTCIFGTQNRFYDVYIWHTKFGSLLRCVYFTHNFCPQDVYIWNTQFGPQDVYIMHMKFGRYDVYIQHTQFGPQDVYIWHTNLALTMRTFGTQKLDHIRRVYLAHKIWPSRRVHFAYTMCYGYRIYRVFNPQLTVLTLKLQVPINSNKRIVIMYCYRVQLLWTVFVCSCQGNC